MLLKGCSIKNSLNEETKIVFTANNIDNCLSSTNDTKVFLTVSNGSNEDLLIRTTNVFLECKIINEDGDTLKPDYKIAHSRDWSDKPYYLVKAHDSINISSVIQKLFYYKLIQGQKYKCELTYYNDFKEFRKSQKEFKKVKMFRGKVILKPFYFEVCEGI